jgi:hypothetical protein
MRGLRPAEQQPPMGAQPAVASPAVQCSDARMRAEAALPDAPAIAFDDQLLEPWRRRLANAPTTEPARLAFAAAHVVLRPSYSGAGHSLAKPGDSAAIAEHIDWERTMALRRHLDQHGFGVAEAMDTAQRFFLGWRNAERLITECGKLRLRHGFIAGAGVDHLPRVNSKADLVDGVVEQIARIQAAGGLAIVLPMAWLTLNRASAQDYVDVYGAIFARATGPLFVHWLGAMFLPVLEGYFPGDSFDRVMALAPDKVRGCKLSLLDAEHEKRVRRGLLARDQFVLTGDDFHFAHLIAGDDPAIVRRTRVADHDVALGAFSHALLGVLDGVAVPAGLALRLLAAGDLAGFHAVMQPCEAYGQIVFEHPTQHYKAGLAFTAWLNGLQDDFTLVNHEQRARDRAHYLRVARAAAACGAIVDAPRAAARLMAQWPSS